MEATMLARLAMAAALSAALGAGHAASAATQQIGKPIEGRAAYVPADGRALKGNDFGPDFNVAPIRPTAPKSSSA
jgi:hypothetical protein